MSTDLSAVPLHQPRRCLFCKEAFSSGEPAASRRTHIETCFMKTAVKPRALLKFVLDVHENTDLLHRFLKSAFGTPIRGAKTRVVVAAVRELCGGRALPEEVAVAIHGPAIRRVLDAATHDPTLGVRRERIDGRTFFITDAAPVIRQRRPRVRIIEDDEVAA